MTPANSPGNTGCNDIRVQRYPTLEEGNDAFPEGGYQVESSPIKGVDHGLELRHGLRNAGLIRRLAEEKRAVYACAVSSPRSAFRELQTSAGERQRITWNPIHLGEPPYFTPMVVCLEEVELRLNSDRDDVHRDWDGTRVVFPKGARLAQGPVLRLDDAGVHSLLTLDADENMSPGQFQVTAVNDADFRFKVCCHPDLLAFMKSPGDRNDKRRDIMIHMVTACFSKLRQDFKDPDGEAGWRNIKPLAALARELEEQHEYMDWSDSDFRPERAAMLLYPHSVPSLERTDN